MDDAKFKEACDLLPDGLCWYDPITAGIVLEIKENVLRAHQHAPQDDVLKECTWKQDEHSEWGEWNTSCGNAFCLEDGTPPENGMKYCCYCGAAINAAKGE